MPGEDRVCLGHCRQLCQRLPPQWLAKRSQCLASAVWEQQAPADLVAEEAMLRHQIRRAPPELLGERLGDRPQQLFPVQLSVHPGHDVLHWGSVWARVGCNARQSRRRSGPYAVRKWCV
jgi:hypothetical protein